MEELLGVNTKIKNTCVLLETVKVLRISDDTLSVLTILSIPKTKQKKKMTMVNQLRKTYSNSIETNFLIKKGMTPQKFVSIIFAPYTYP